MQVGEVRYTFQLMAPGGCPETVHETNDRLVRRDVSTHGPGGLPRDDQTSETNVPNDVSGFNSWPRGVAPRLVVRLGEPLVHETNEFQLMAPGGCPETRMLAMERWNKADWCFNSWPRGVAPRPRPPHTAMRRRWPCFNS